MSSTPSSLPASTSKYSSDLQQVLSRSVSIASLPLQQLNSQLTTLQDRSTALDAVNGKFTALQSALQGVSSAAVSTLAQVSNNTVLAAQSTSAAAPGSYSIHVANAGAHSSALSQDTLPAVQDPSTQSISVATSFTLTVGVAAPLTITPASNTLSALADAINSSGANVSATIVNLGSPASPNYRLSLQTTKLGNIPIQLNDGADLLGTLSAGTEATYQVNGLPAVPISSDSTSVTIAPGVTVNLLAAGDSTVVVTRSSSTQSNALSSFVAAYNAALDTLSQNRGSGGGALTGDALISTLGHSLRNLSGFTGGAGAAQNLTDLGLTFDKTGKLNFDQTVFSNLTAAHSSDVAAFLGSTSTGGFLKAANDILNGLEDPGSGTIDGAVASAQAAVTNQNQKISDAQDRLDTITTALTAKISAADALIASLEQQANYFTTLFASINGSINGTNSNK